MLIRISYDFEALLCGMSRSLAMITNPTALFFLEVLPPFGPLLITKAFVADMLYKGVCTTGLCDISSHFSISYDMPVTFI